MEILSGLEEPESKTSIMYRTHLSYSQLKAYLEFMVIKGLIHERGGRWQMTAKGKAFLRASKEANQILNSD